MRLLISFSLIALLATQVALAQEANCSSAEGSNNLTVKTSTGTYTGLIDPKYPNTRQFLSVPFAEPPVLSRRWLPPQKLPPSGKHHYATRMPPSCPQFVTSVTSLFSLNLTKGNLIYNGNQNDSSGLVGEATSEDCLYLAIWAPKDVAPQPKPNKGLPVLFFITGGGFILGGVDIPWQTPTSWVERSKSHIVVTINYRLDIMGFPRSRGLPPDKQNLGILDMRAALEWVRDNIAAFGGDPDRITLWGQSAGSIGADILAYAYYEDPIAQAFWHQSGMILSGPNRQDPTYSNFSFVARHFDCEFPCDEDGSAELACMRRVPYAQLINFIGQRNDAGKTPALFFNMVADNLTIFADYFARAEAGKIARRPAMISNTANEGSSLVPWPINNITDGPWQPPITAFDIEGMCSSLNSTMYRTRLGVPVFRFLYAGVFPNLNHYKWLGSYHASDITMAFGTYRILDIIANTTTFQVEVSRSLQDHVLAFAMDPYHGPQKMMGWMPMNASEPHGGDMISFGADGKVVQHIDGDEVDGACRGRGGYNPFP
ncbi:hypothetical protein RBB50_005131 [Rhinocladiella similis]